MDKDSYRRAKEALKAQDYKMAERAFELTLDSIDENHHEYNLVQSFYGLTQVMSTNKHGVLRCRDAAGEEIKNGDTFLILACAEWSSNNRKRAIDALQYGIKIDPNHKLLIRASSLECRKQWCISFLSRNHKINCWIGRIMRRPPDKVITIHDLLY